MAGSFNRRVTYIVQLVSPMQWFVVLPRGILAIAVLVAICRGPGGARRHCGRQNEEIWGRRVEGEKEV